MNWQDRLNPRAGGAEAHLHEVFGRLAGRGHRVHLLVSGWPGAEPRVTIDGMDVHRAGGRHSFLFAGPRYHNRHFREPYDVLVEDLNKVPLFSPRWSRAPVVLLVHHLFGATAFAEASLPIATGTWLLERPLAREYRGVPVQAVSESTARDLVRRGFDPDIRVIPNGVDLESYSPDPLTPRFAEPTILYLGRLKRYKRIDVILRAVAQLTAGGVDVRAIIAGTGDARPGLERLRDRLGLAGRVDMPGYVDEDEKRRLFRSAWVHVLTSPKEGWGITVMEAAACGTPTVASDAPGLRDSVVHGETGFLVPHGDVAALAATLRTLVEDAGLRSRLGRNAAERAATFTWERAARDTEQHLLEVVDAARRRPATQQP